VDGIVGVANSDGGKRPGGLGSSTLDCRRTFVHPSRHAGGELLKKQSISGRDYCSAGLEGAGMKRRLVLQPELRELIARLSQHRPRWRSWDNGCARRSMRSSKRGWDERTCG
jgi:hypothetical protein